MTLKKSQDFLLRRIYKFTQNKYNTLIGEWNSTSWERNKDYQ